MRMERQSLVEPSTIHVRLSEKYTVRYLKAIFCKTPCPRDIHLAGGPAPEGIVGHIARPGGIKNSSPGRQKFKKPAHGYL